MKKVRQKKNHGYQRQSKPRGIMPSAVRDCSTYKFQCTSFLKFESHNKQAGFTLIELMVVIVILGLLAGVIIPRFMGETDKAKVATAKMQIASLESALKMYKLDNGSYPSTEQGLQALVEAPTAGNLPTNWRKGGYLEKGKVPKDPWKNDYIYICPGSHGDFDLSSLGADGEPGGEGFDKDINNWEIE